MRRQGQALARTRRSMLYVLLCRDPCRFFLLLRSIRRAPTGTELQALAIVAWVMFGAANRCVCRILMAQWMVFKRLTVHFDREVFSPVRALTMLPEQVLAIVISVGRTHNRVNVEFC